MKMIRARIAAPITPAMISLSRAGAGVGNDGAGAGGCRGGVGEAFRSGTGVGEGVPGMASGAPHLLQKFFPGPISVPQD